MAPVFRAAAIVDLSLILYQDSWAHQISPVGGSHLAQLGCLFVLAYIMFEIAEILFRQDGEQ